MALDEITMGRELKMLDYVKLTARSRHHAQNDYSSGFCMLGGSQHMDLSHFWLFTDGPPGVLCGPILEIGDSSKG